MKKMLSAFTILLLMVVPVFGDGPKNLHVIPNTKIEGAENVIPYGELVQVTVKSDNNVPNLYKTTHSWKVYDENHKVKNVYTSPDGKTLIFGAGIKKTKFLVVLDTTYTFVDKDDKGVITGVETISTGIDDAVVKIGEDDVVPPKPPGPGPDPEPPLPPKPLPDSPLGLVKPSVDAFNLMKAPSKAVVAKLVADNYNLIKNKIAGQEIKTLKDAYAQLSELNGKALRENKADFAEWNVWDQTVKKSVYDLYLAKKLTVLEDYIGAYAEIANSLTYAAEIK